LAIPVRLMLNQTEAGISGAALLSGRLEVVVCRRQTMQAVIALQTALPILGVETVKLFGPILLT
jgi:hypothetical protein